MLLSHSQQFSLIKPYDTGAHANDTDDVIGDIPQLSTLKRSQNREIDIDCLHKSTNTLPNELKLRLNLKPIPLTLPVITAQLKQGARLLQPCQFYQMSSLYRDMQRLHLNTLWSGIDLSFEGTAFYHQHGDEQLLLPTNPHFSLTYQKDQVIDRYNFVLPDQTHYFQSDLNYKKNYRITHLDDRIQGMNIMPLIPYSGYIEQPIVVSAVCQSYVVLCDAPANRTALTLYTQHYCNKNSIKLSTPQNMTPYRLCADSKYLPTIQLTLAGWLTSGYLKISVMCKITHTEHTYCSKNYKQIDANTQTVDVLFLKNS